MLICIELNRHLISCFRSNMKLVSQLTQINIALTNLWFIPAEMLGLHKDIYLSALEWLIFISFFSFLPSSCSYFTSLGWFLKRYFVLFISPTYSYRILWKGSEHFLKLLELKRFSERNKNILYCIAFFRSLWILHMFIWRQGNVLPANKDEKHLLLIEP